MSRSLPWILVILCLAAIGWMIYFPPKEDMTAHKEKEAFQDTIHILRDSLSRVKADIVVKSNTVDSTLSKMKVVINATLKDRDRWRASYKATKARLDSLSDKDYRPVADSLLTAAGQKIDSLYQTVGELKVSTEALTGQLQYERDARTKATNLMQLEVEQFRQRNQKLESDNVKERRKGNRKGLGGFLFGFGAGYVAGSLSN